MMSSMLILSLAYTLVAALLLTLCITLPGRRMLKIALIALVSVVSAGSQLLESSQGNSDRAVE